MAQSNEQGSGEKLYREIEYAVTMEYKAPNGEPAKSRIDRLMRMILADRKQHELEARKKLLEELTRKAKRYNENDPVIDLDIWAVPLVVIEEKLKTERRQV